MLPHTPRRDVREIDARTPLVAWDERGSGAPPPILCRPGHLFLGGIAPTQGHRHKLSNHPFLDTEAVKPRLFRDDQVILWAGMQIRGPRLPRDGIDRAGRDFHRERILGVMPIDPSPVEVDPYGLGLIHRQQHAPVGHPRRRDPRPDVIDMRERKGAQPGWQVVHLVVVRDAQGVLELDAEAGLRMDLRKREVQAVIDQFHHGVYSLSLPVSVTDLTHDAQDRVVRHALQFTDDLRHEGWSAPDDGLQVP